MEETLPRFIIASDPYAVRNGLAALLASPMIAELGPQAQGSAEIALAEVLNNVVKHGYAGAEGEITVTLQRTASGILVVVEDLGAAFPAGELPEGRLPNINSFDDLPEGGFGWHLIRTLVRDLSYRRKAGGNRLTFRLPITKE